MRDAPIAPLRDATRENVELLDDWSADVIVFDWLFTGARDRCRARGHTRGRARSLPLSASGSRRAAAVQRPEADGGSVGCRARPPAQCHDPPLLGGRAAGAQRCPCRAWAHAAEGLERPAPRRAGDLRDDRPGARLLEQSPAPRECPLRGPRVRAVREGLGVTVACGERRSARADQLQHELHEPAARSPSASSTPSPGCASERC